MGCSSSKYVVNINTEGQGIDCQKVLNLLKLDDDEVNRLYRCFVNYDLSGDGKLSIVEFLTMLDEDETFLTKEIFNEITSGHDSLTFKDFVITVWRYCVIDKKQIAEMIFELFDTDYSSELSDSEIKKMLTAMAGKKGIQHDINRLLKTINHAKPGIVTKKEFIDCSLKNPALLFPAFRLQKILQEKVCGSQFWMNQFSRAQSLLNSPEVQALYHKKSSNNVTAVTPLNQPSKAAAAVAGDSLVVIDFHAPAAVSEKKKTPIKHSASVGDQPLSTISPALYSQSSHHSNDHSSGKKQRHAVIHKQHTTGEIPDHPNSQPRSRAVIPKQHSSEDNHHSSKHHQSSSKKHHHVATDSSDPSDSPLHSAKHSTKSSKSPPNGGGEWVTASRKEFY